MATAKKQDVAQTEGQPEGPQAMAEPEGGWPADEFTGVGGEYIRDPYTGIRRPAVAPAPTTEQPDAA